VEAQDVAIVDGVGDGVGVQLLLEDVLGGGVGADGAVHLDVAGVLLEDGRAGKAEQLRPGEERLDGLVVVAELGAVAFVEDDHQALVAQGGEPLLVGALAPLAVLLGLLAGLVQGQAELLDGGDDDLVGVVLGEQAAHQGLGVGVLLDAAFLKAVEFVAGLAVEVLAVDHEQTFFDVGVVLEQRGGLERGQRLAAAGGVPDVAVAPVLMDAVDDGLHGIDLVRPHDHELLFAGHQDHVAADHLAESALGEELLGEGVQVGDLAVVGLRPLVDGQEALVGVEGEVPRVVVGEVVGVVAVADDEQLHEAQQGGAVAVADVVLVVDNLLHGPARIDAEGLELDLHQRQAVDEQDDVVAVMAAVGVDAQLVDDLEVVLAPVLEVDQHVVQRGAVLALEVAVFPQGGGGLEDIGADDVVAQAGELGVGELDLVQRLELGAEVLLQRGLVADVGAVAVFLVVDQLGDELLLDLAFLQGHPMPSASVVSAIDGAPAVLSLCWDSTGVASGCSLPPKEGRGRRALVHGERVLMRRAAVVLQWRRPDRASPRRADSSRGWRRSSARVRKLNRML
jgi:hypothetical protein